jgi:hypothetical protein
MKEFLDKIDKIEKIENILTAKANMLNEAERYSVSWCNLLHSRCVLQEEFIRILKDLVNYEHQQNT